MTVQQLIDKLSMLPNKAMKVYYIHDNAVGEESIVAVEVERIPRSHEFRVVLMGGG